MTVSLPSLRSGLAALSVAIAPTLTLLDATPAHACACGCSVFDVGGLGAFPQEDDHGGSVFTEFYAANQVKNWIGTHAASGDLNNDKRVTTDWVSVGAQYMFNRSWGAMVKVPYANRDFYTADTPGDNTVIDRFRSSDVGDMEIMGMYTGFDKTMSTGITFGVKLPTGTYTAPGFDRDTQIGSGSTDLLLGAFHRTMLTGDNAWQSFSQIRAQIPLLTRSAYNADNQDYESYRPGVQIDGAVGIVYNNGYNVLGWDKVAPLVQLIGSHREHDTGSAADPLNSGYDRIFISPGIEFTKVLDEQNKRLLKLYGDVEVPIYQRTNAASDAYVQANPGFNQGQLTAPIQVKLRASYNF